MSSDPHQSPEADLRRRKRRGWLIIGACFAGLLALFGWSLFGPNPPLVISKQTTYITSPLRPDGTPDYEAYLLSKQNRKLPREENAAVVMWQVMGPHQNYFSRERWRELEAELGDLSPPQGIKRFAEIPLFYEVPSVEAWSEAAATFQLSRFKDRQFERLNFFHPVAELPWRRSDIPLLADWLLAHDPAFDYLVAGAARPGFYSPPEDAHTILHAVERLHALRACLAWGESDFPRATENLVAMLRWAKHFSANCQRSGLWAAELPEFALRMARTFVSDCDVSKPDLQRLRQAILATTEESSFLKNELELARISAIRDVMNGMEWPGFSTTESTLDLIRRVKHICAVYRTDINVSLELINKVYDRCEEISRMKQYGQRQQATVTYEDEITELFLRGKATCESFRIIAAPVRDGALARINLGFSSAPYLSNSLAAKDAYVAQKQLTLVAISLAIYRVDRGEYPATLADFQPPLTTDLMMDTFHGKPLVYRRTKEGYLLYSFGPNGIDDGGDSHCGANAAEHYRYLKAGIDVNRTETARLSQIKITADDYATHVPVSFTTWHWEANAVNLQAVEESCAIVEPFGE